MTGPVKKLLLNLPVMIALLITVVFSVDAPLFRPLKTEMMFAWMVVVLIPLAVVLFLVQAVLWCTVPASRPLPRRK